MDVDPLKGPELRNSSSTFRATVSFPIQEPDHSHNENSSVSSDALEAEELLLSLLIWK